MPLETLNAEFKRGGAIQTLLLRAQAGTY